MKNFFVRMWQVVESPYGRRFSVIIVLQIVATICFANGFHLTREADLERDLSGFLIFSVFLLVFLNTVAFSSHIYPIVSAAGLTGNPSDKERETFAGHWHFVNLAVIGSVFASGIFALLVFLAWCDVFRTDHWNLVMNISDYASLTIFFIFLVTDLCCLEVCNNALVTHVGDSSRKNVYEDEKTLLERYIWGVDVPGFLGLLVIAVLAHLIYPEFAANRNTASIAYCKGFTTGAVALHIAFSQASLALLSSIRK